VKTFLVTGSTQGLGLAIARALAADSDQRVVLGVRDLARGADVARAIGSNVEAKRIDCASLTDVRRFAAEWEGPLAGLVNNAGVQLTGAMRKSADGYEETLAVNHLAALELTVRLLPHLEGGRVLFIGSGTHNPDHPTATIFGFRGARFTSIEALARGESDGSSDRQRGMDRYATSKLLNMVTAMELARQIPRERTTFLTLDPGLMAGTGLARSAPAPVRFVWSKLLPYVARLLPDTSTPERSAAAAAWLLTDSGVVAQSGEVFGFDRRPSRHVWTGARDPQLARTALAESLAFLGLSADGLWQPDRSTEADDENPA
jgi:NAD(P)-dependent dehydrogenase (short-subunit alcohol dehydrogenase family)